MFNKRSKSKERVKELTDFILDDVALLENNDNVQSSAQDEEIVEHPYVDKPKSRAHSRRSSIDGSFYNEFLQNVSNDEPFKTLLGSGLGKVIITQTGLIEELAKRNNLKLPKGNFDQTCSNIEDFLDDFNNKLTSTVTEINTNLDNKIKQQFSNKRNSYIQDSNSENFHIENFANPSDSDRLSDIKLTLVNNTFPIRHKFSGSNNPSITEFLRNVKYAQNQCFLSEKQFKTVFLRCTTSSVYEHVACLIDGDISVNEIINSLLLKYDTRLKPEQATLLLNNYIIPKNADFNTVVSDIMSLAQRAVLAQPPSCRKQIYDYSAIDVLIKSLPTDSQNDGRKIKADLFRELERAPTFDEMTRALMPYSSAIDFNYNKDRKSKAYPLTKQHQKLSVLQIDQNTPFIRRNKKVMRINEMNVLPDNKIPQFSRNKNRTFPQASPNNNSKYQNRSSGLYDKVYKTSKPNSQDYRQNTYQNYNSKYKTDTENSNSTYINRSLRYNSSNPRKNLFCKLCGKTGHSSTGFCWEMRTNSGAHTLCNPVPMPCEKCLEEENKELYHSDQLCFNRPRAKWLKENNMWNPPSAETRKEMDKKAALFFR